MRTTTDSIGNISYPDEICFAFNPTYVKVENCSAKALTVSVTDYTTTHSMEVMCYNGTCVINLSRTLQLLFDTYYIVNQRTKEVTVNVGSFTFTTVVIWGYICPGERFGGSRTVRWFRFFPMTVSVFDGQQFTERTTIESSGIRIGQSWDFTFDYTFQAGPAQTINFLVDDSRDGIFLRWIDRHGVLQYWLFSKGIKETKNNQGGNELTMNYIDRELNSFRNIKRQQYFFSEITQALCAPNVTEEEYTMLESILTSPVIDLYHPSTIVGWEPVRIAKGTNKRSTDVLQDFEFEIELPNINAQSL